VKKSGERKPKDVHVLALSKRTNLRELREEDIGRWRSCKQILGDARRKPQERKAVFLGQAFDHGRNAMRACHDGSGTRLEDDPRHRHPKGVFLDRECADASDLPSIDNGVLNDAPGSNDEENARVTTWRSLFKHRLAGFQ
jgi:hypothetical protein